MARHVSGLPSVAIRRICGTRVLGSVHQRELSISQQLMVLDSNELDRSRGPQSCSDTSSQDNSLALEASSSYDSRAVTPNAFQPGPSVCPDAAASPFPRVPSAFCQPAPETTTGNEESQVSPLIIIHDTIADSLTKQDKYVTQKARSDSEFKKRKRDRSSSSSQGNRDIVLVDSKERLSEMATNIRGISNALSNVALTPMVKTVFVVTKILDEELTPKTRQIVEWLLNWSPQTTSDDEVGDDEDKLGPIGPIRENRLSIYVEEVVAKQKEFGLAELKQRYPHKVSQLRLWRPDTIAKYANKIDLVVTLGGDGTVLYTSWLFQKIVPPTLSFALGTLGFMTENQFDDFKEILDEHLTHGIRCTLRMRFDCTIWRTKNADQTGRDDLAREVQAAGEQGGFSSHWKDCEYSILNEVVVDRGPNPFVTMTELYGDNELLTCIRADGVVISTPTGSTAYSMSAGGSLVHPDIPAQLISPICPHTLSFRPLVVPDSMALHLGVPYDSRSSAFASFDGKMRVELGRGDVLAISISRYPFPKVLPQTSTPISWVQQLSRTLHWNEQKRPKRGTL